MNWGENPGAKGTFIINETSLQLLPKHQTQYNYDRVALDFEHNTVPNSPTYKGEPAEVAAYGTPEILSNDGLYLKDLEWTKEGIKYVGGGHYHDLSPTIFPNARGEVIFLHSAAACRQGALVGRVIELSVGLPSKLLGLGPLVALTTEEEMIRNRLRIPLELWQQFSGK